MTQFTKTHGLSRHPIYRLWGRIKNRCYTLKETARSAKYYRNKGIKVCDDWRNDFMSFYRWALSNGWFDGCTIDRVDSNGNYEPSNCQLTTKSINSKKAFKDNHTMNRGSNSRLAKLNEDKVLEIRKLWAMGEKLSKLAKKFNVSAGVLYAAATNKKWKHVETIDMFERPRIRRAKLTEEKVKEIKRLLAAGHRNDHLSVQFCISETTISNIKVGKTWKHVII